MACFLFCIGCGLWDIYNFLTYIFPAWELPYIVITSQENQICRVINMLCLNWSPVLGGLLIIFGVVGLFCMNRDEFNFESFKYFIVVFAALTSFGMML